MRLHIAAPFLTLAPWCTSIATPILQASPLQVVLEPTYEQYVEETPLYEEGLVEVQDVRDEEMIALLDKYAPIIMLSSV